MTGNPTLHGVTKLVTDYPNLWAYTRDLYQVPGVSETVNMDHIKTHYYDQPLTEYLMWNQRYSSESYAYGTEPNDFLVAMLNRLPEGKVLCLAGLEFLHLRECVREVHEGEFHHGPGAVVQALARKP